MEDKKTPIEKASNIAFLFMVIVLVLIFLSGCKTKKVIENNSIEYGVEDVELRYQSRLDSVIYSYNQKIRDITETTTKEANTIYIEVQDTSVNSKPFRFTNGGDYIEGFGVITNLKWHKEKVVSSIRVVSDSINTNIEIYRSQIDSLERVLNSLLVSSSDKVEKVTKKGFNSFTWYAFLVGFALGILITIYLRKFIRKI